MTVCFTPFNKQAMHLGGLAHEDELRHVAHELGFTGVCGELNVLDELWTARVTSHVPLREVADLITPERVRDAVVLIDGALRAAGKEAPRIAVAGLNPHAGEGGVFGREEIDVIAPGVELARAAGAQVEGPYPADTLFLRARDGRYDAVVSMYHDQGQIGLKLMGFDRGVTVFGGLPIPIATPAHGTAYNIAGRNRADPRAIRQAFNLCTRMAAAHRRARAA
jgi:4-hydroxythreonine-4-phosphate dehydrogenase